MRQHFVQSFSKQISSLAQKKLFFARRVVRKVCRLKLQSMPTAPRHLLILNFISEWEHTYIPGQWYITSTIQPNQKKKITFFCWYRTLSYFVSELVVDKPFVISNQCSNIFFIYLFAALTHFSHEILCIHTPSSRQYYIIPVTERQINSPGEQSYNDVNCCCCLILGVPDAKCYSTYLLDARWWQK